MFSVVGVIYFFFFFLGETKIVYLPATTMCVKDPPHSTGSQQHAMPLNVQHNRPPPRPPPPTFTPAN